MSGIKAFYRKRNDRTISELSEGSSPLLHEKYHSKIGCIMDHVKQLNMMMSYLPKWKQRKIKDLPKSSEYIDKVFDDLGLLLCKFLAMTKLVSILAESDNDIGKCGIIFKLAYFGLIQLDQGKRFSHADERDTLIESNLKQEARPFHSMGYTGVSLDDFRKNKRKKKKYDSASYKGVAKRCVDMLSETFLPVLHGQVIEKQRAFGFQNDDDLQIALKAITLPNFYTERCQTIQIHYGFTHWLVVRDFGASSLEIFTSKIKNSSQELTRLKGESDQHNKLKEASSRSVKKLKEASSKSVGSACKTNPVTVKKRRIIIEDSESEGGEIESEGEGEIDNIKPYCRMDDDSGPEEPDEIENIKPYTIEQLRVINSDSYVSEESSSINAPAPDSSSCTECSSSDESDIGWSNYYINQLQTRHFIHDHYFRAVEDGDAKHVEYPKDCNQSGLQALYNINPKLVGKAIEQKIDVSNAQQVESLVKLNCSGHSKVYETPDGRWVALTRARLYIDGKSVYKVQNWVLADYFLRSIKDPCQNVRRIHNPYSGTWPKLFGYKCLLGNCLKFRLTPPLYTLADMDDKELGSVKNFKVEIEKFGAIEWLEDVDLRGVDLNLVVQIERSKVFLHPAKTNAGKQLNKAAKVSVYKLISASDVKYENNTMKLKKECEKVGTEFVSYDKKGTFVFKVKKFV